MTLTTKNQIELLPLQKFTVNYQLLNLHWLNSRTIALLDTREALHIMDVRSQEELETVDLSQVRLVYASSHFKGLATGGNVSRAFVRNCIFFRSSMMLTNPATYITGF
jgi:hypothetical protein